MRACINLGNAVLARKGAVEGMAQGISVDLARSLAQWLGRDLVLLEVDAAARSVEAVRVGRADVGFFAIDPQRSDGIGFTAPYLCIEGAYLVREDGALQVNEQVDRPGVRVVVGKGSAYDLFLSRTLTQATILRAPTPAQVLDVFLEQRAEVAAGIRPQLAAQAAAREGLRLLPGHFMVIEQAMGLAAARGPRALAALREFVERVKFEGEVQRWLRRHGVQATVAPASPAIPPAR